jgi:CDP-diacylglycerol--serine O-phosphatidyltransferase
MRPKMVPVRYLVPNFFTLLALCAGITSIRAAIEGRYDLAIGLIVLAAFLDGVDGRVARALKAQSRFGAELDSLADFVSFGVAPAFLIFMWAMAPLKDLGWIAVLVFASAASLRLARFNAALDEERPRWQGNFFTGVPAPAGALLVMLPLYLDGSGLLPTRSWPFPVALYVVLVAALMVSTLPTYSGKLAGERIAREYVAPALVLAAFAMAMLVAYPHATLAVASLAYLGLIPIGVRRFLELKRQHAAGVGPVTSPPPVEGTTAVEPSPAVPPLTGAPPGETRH